MGEKIKRHLYILFIDALIFLTCIMGIYQINSKAGLPVQLSNGSPFQITKSFTESEKYLTGRPLSEIDGIKFISREEIEVYLDGKNIGDTVKFDFAGKEYSAAEVKLIQFYSASYKWLVLSIGILFFAVAIFILLNSHEVKQAKLYHAVNITTAVIMMTTWGNYNIEPYGAGIFIRTIFHLAYAFVPAVFLHFVFVFPKDDESKHKNHLRILYIISGMLFLFLSYRFLNVLQLPGADSFSSYVSGFDFYRIYIIASVLLGIFLFINSFSHSSSIVERKKIKWLLLGFIIGPGSFILLWVIPQAITTYGILSEELVIILMAAIPITFGISIYKYHLLDIDLLLNRSTVYTIVLLLVLMVYILIVGTAAVLFGELTLRKSILLSALLAVLIGIGFSPVKNKVQQIIDKKLFRIKYNFRTAHNLLIQQIKDSFTTDILAQRITSGVSEVLQSEFTSVKFFNNEPGNPELSGAESDSIILKINETPGTPSIIADPDYVEQGIHFEFTASAVNHCKIIVPVYSFEKKICGYIALGKRKSLLRYSTDDIEFLEDVAFQAGITADKIQLQKELLLKQEETRRLKELSEMKSFFVSSVSHELKLPLSSIILWADILESKKSREEKSNELHIIKEESLRLTRLIDDVLDYANIERGTKKYHFEELDFNETILEAVNRMSYQLEMNKFKAEVNLAEEQIEIYADSDAIIQAVMNLISNAIKYSSSRKRICISSAVTEDEVSLSVKDEGIGIPEIDLKNIFKKYFRVDSSKNIKGMGIGLTILKNIMDSHKGSIKVDSVPGEGSTFTLIFPRVKHHEKIADNRR